MFFFIFVIENSGYFCVIEEITNRISVSRALETINNYTAQTQHRRFSFGENTFRSLNIIEQRITRLRPFDFVNIGDILFINVQ